MKKIIFMAFLAVLPMLASAEEAKLGYINRYDLLSIMPEVSKVEEYMADYNKKNVEYLQKMYAEYQTKLQQYNDDKATLSEAIRKDREGELQSLAMRIETAEQSFQEEAQKEQTAKLQPILQKISDAIDVVSKRMGLLMVFDTSSGTPVLYHSDKAVDITSAVKKELGML